MEEFLTGVRNGRSRARIEHIRQLIGTERADTAAAMKKQLPAYTLQACFRGNRVMPNMVEYNNLIVIDIDHAAPERIDEMRRLIEGCPFTYAAFLSPSGSGFKVLVRLSGTPPDTGEKELKAYHTQAFRQVGDFFSTLLAHEVDESGKDINRFTFDSFDPQLFFNSDARLFDVKDIAPPTRKRSAKEPKASEMLLLPALPAHAEAPADGVGTDVTCPETNVPFLAGKEQMYLKFRRALRRTSAYRKYREGDRNNYIFRLLCECNREGIPMEDAEKYTAGHFVKFPTDELLSASKSAYSHTDEFNFEERKRQEEVAEKRARKEKKKGVGIEELEQHLTEQCDFRYNVVLDQVEVKWKEEETWKTIDDRVENSLWRKLFKDKGENAPQTLHLLLNSDFASPFDPFASYFHSLPAWDEQTDYIGRWADRITTDRPDFFHTCFQKWIVAMVASWLVEEVVNHTVLLLSGAQGCGKTTFANGMLPPELRAYYSSALFDPQNKDTLVKLSTCGLINMDELESLTTRQQAELKETVTKSDILLRLAYRKNNQKYTRRASLMGSINHQDFLSDTSGSRRFLTFNVIGEIDNATEIPYEGLYAQAYYLFTHGYRYWFTQPEIEEVNSNNEEFRVRTLEEELFCTFFRKPEEGEKKIALSASQIISKIASKTCINSTMLNAVKLGRLLKKWEYQQKITRGTYRFLVYEIGVDEINNTDKETDID